MKEVKATTHEASAKYQYFATVVVNILSICYGVNAGWTSASVILLKSDESPLPTGKITIDEASWITSLLCVGGLAGNVLFGYVTNQFGRKIPLLLMAVPTVISWSLVLFAQNVYYLYASRVLNGIVGGGVFIITPLYLSDIASDSIRGSLGSTMMLNVNAGTLLAFVLGNFCDYKTTPIVIIVLAVIFAVAFFFFPESPIFLLKQNRISAAEKSISFYQCISSTDKEALQFEMDKMKNSLGDAKNDVASNNASSWTDFITERLARKAITIGIVLASLNQFCGCFAMLNYTASIFEEAGSSLSPNMSAIIVGVIQLIGSYAATNLVDRAGRKFLFMVSTIGTALGLISLGSYTMLKTWGWQVESFNWIPVASFSFVIFLASCAILTLPFLVISEILPEDLKDFGASFCMILLWIFAFLITKYLPFMTAAIDFHGTMFLFAGACLASAVFILLFMPETKGKSYDQIMNLL